MRERRAVMVVYFMFVVKVGSDGLRQLDIKDRRKGKKEEIKNGLKRLQCLLFRQTKECKI